MNRYMSVEIADIGKMVQDSASIYLSDCSPSAFLNQIMFGITSVQDEMEMNPEKKVDLELLNDLYQRLDSLKKELFNKERLLK